MWKKIWRTITFGNLYGIFLVGFAGLALYGAFVKPKTSAPTRVEAQPSHPDLVLSRRVASVNAHAATLMMSKFSGFSMDIPAPCLLASHIEKDAKLTTDAIIQQVHNKFQVECKLTDEVRSKTYTVFNKIADSGKLPANVWAFVFFDEDKRWDKVGLFDDQAICDSTLKSVMDAGFGVKPCQQWFPMY